jgi:hypothetical protein
MTAAIASISVTRASRAASVAVVAYEKLWTVVVTAAVNVVNGTDAGEATGTENVVSFPFGISSDNCHTHPVGEVVGSSVTARFDSERAGPVEGDQDRRRRDDHVAGDVVHGLGRDEPQRARDHGPVGGDVLAGDRLVVQRRRRHPALPG